eukprot:9706014-Prorocentrum_lima.AAC.1
MALIIKVEIASVQETHIQTDSNEARGQDIRYLLEPRKRKNQDTAVHRVVRELLSLFTLISA